MEELKVIEIMNEISDFCGNECNSVMCCPEEECVLFRIEQIVNAIE